MKTKTFIIGLFLAMCLAISLPAIHQVAQTQALQGGTIGPAPASGPSYYPVGSDCVLYLDFGDGLESASDHSSFGNDATIYGATFVENGIYLDGLDDDIMVPHDASLNKGVSGALSTHIWLNVPDVALRVLLYKLNGGVQLYSGLRSTGAMWYKGGVDYDSDVNLLTASSWTLVSFTTIVGTTKEWKCYKNGSQFGATNAPESEGDNTVTDLYIGSYNHSAFYWKGTIGQILQFNTVQSSTDILNYFNATKARYGVASLDPKYRNYQYAQEMKHEKSSLYRVPRNASVSSTMRGTRGASANYRPPVFQNAPRQGSARAN